MKLKKKVKRFLLIILLIAIALVVGFIVYKNLNKTEEVPEVKIVSEVNDFGYQLKDTKSAKYKEMFAELKKILSEEEVDEEKYANKLAEMFIYDFYSLSDKTAKTDVGGVDFVHPAILENFLQNAQNTYYKYIENNIYNNRKQSLPTVSDITIETTEQQEFAYGNETDPKAYVITASWNYTDNQFSDYQTKATLVFVHDDIKLYLVELQ